MIQSIDGLSFVNHSVLVATGKCEIRFPCGGSDTTNGQAPGSSLRQMEVSFPYGEP